MPNIIWYFILLALFIYRLKNNNPKMFKFCGIAGILLFLVCSTSYVPKKLINSIEKSTLLLNHKNLTLQKHIIYMY